MGGLPRAGKTSFTNRIQSQIDGVEVFSEENYVNQVNPYGREYALDYTENADFLVKTQMIKGVAAATAARKPVIVESNYFVDIRVRAMYRQACLTRDHMPIYVSVYVPEDIRSGNKVLDKYTQSDNEMFIGLNKRPRRTEGFVVMTTREVNEYLKEYNDITSTNKGRSS